MTSKLEYDNILHSDYNDLNDYNDYYGGDIVTMRMKKGMVNWCVQPLLGD